MVNFTPGTGSHRDFAPEGHAAFASSHDIVQGILQHEQSSESGLNGHLLLLHLGSERKDKFYTKLGELIDELADRDYSFVRIDQLLHKSDSRSP